MFKMIYINKFKLLTYILILIILNGCGTTNKMSFYDKTESTNLSEAVYKIALNATKAEIYEAFGEPKAIEKIDDSKSTHLIYGNERRNSDIEFQIVDGKMNRYHFSSDTYQTVKGITIGSTKEEVTRAYGRNYYERADTGAEVIGYFDKNKEVNIEFILNEVVVGIMVSKVN